MSNKFKKLSLGVITFAAAALLVACGNSSSSSKTQESSSAKKEQILIATDGDTKPYSYVVDGKPTGYDVELAKKVFEKLPEYDAKVEVTEFNSILTGIDAGRYQVGANNIGWSEERSKKYIYSYPVSKTDNAIATRKGDNVSSLDDLSGKSTEASAGVNYTEILLNWNKSNPDKKEIVVNYADNLPLGTRLGDVESKKIDFVLHDTISLNTVIEDQGYDLQVSPIKVKDDGNAYSGKDFFIFANDEEGKKLEEKVNKILADFEKDGTLKELSKKFFNGDFVPDASDYK